MRRPGFRVQCTLFALPSLTGVLFFYLVPYGRMLAISVEGGFGQYLSVLQNGLFRKALLNTLRITALSVAASLSLAVVIVWAVRRTFARLRGLRFAFLLPILLPSVSIVVVWRALFGDGNITATLMRGTQDSWRALLPIVTLFVWKNTGYNVVLLLAAIHKVPESMLEAAELDGAGGLQKQLYFTIPFISPTLFFLVTLMVVYSLRIFRESYLYYATAFPPDAVYTVPYFINNHFNRVEYPRLASAGVLLSFLVLVAVAAGYFAERKTADFLGDDAL